MLQKKAISKFITEGLYNTKQPLAHLVRPWRFKKDVKIKLFMIFRLSLWSLGIVTRAWVPTMVLCFFEADAYMNFFIWRSRNKICRMYDSYYFDYFLSPDLVLIDLVTRKYTSGDLTARRLHSIVILWILMSLNLVRFDLLEVDYFPSYLQMQKYESLVTGTDVIHRFCSYQVLS